MAYATISIASAKTALASRLGNLSKSFWTDAELGRLLVEAQRTYNALTGFWRERGVFNTTQGQRFYDLPTVLPALLGYTVTDRDMVVLVQDALQEPASPTVWTGSEQFTLDDVTAALERRRNQFLLDTGMVLSVRQVNPSGPPATRTALPSTVIDIRRCCWQELDGTESPLMRDDEVGFQLFKNAWNLNPGPPQCFSIGVVPPLQIQVAPAPLLLGKLNLLTVEIGATLNPVAGVVMGIPDDWTWGVKFGALADLLQQDGIANDTARAAYCEQRYQECVKLAGLAATMMMATIDDVEVVPMGVLDADRFATGWSNGQGAPVGMLTAGRNLVAVSPVADAGPYGISMDVVRNAPVNLPFLQIPTEAFDAILDYSEHLGTFKLGGEEFARAQALLDRFYRVCGVNISRRRVSVPDLDTATNAVERNDVQMPRTDNVDTVRGQA